mmetsp:Transcript_14468/g.34010  ORF Transcript_14468/g.34010 Transcript_14468/m.34010 type:complete len:208 (-) Transcript_14468:208-831(-)
MNDASRCVCTIPLRATNLDDRSATAGLDAMWGEKGFVRRRRVIPDLVHVPHCRRRSHVACAQCVSQFNVTPSLERHTGALNAGNDKVCGGDCVGLGATARGCEGACGEDLDVQKAPHNADPELNLVAKVLFRGATTGCEGSTLDARLCSRRKAHTRDVSGQLVTQGDVASQMLQIDAESVGKRELARMSQCANLERRGVAQFERLRR